MKREFRQLRLSQLDRNLEPAHKLPSRPSAGWLASVREALGLSQRQVGNKMRVSGQAIQQFEKAEAEDRITLRALRQVAGTMGCEVVYVFVAKSGSFAELAEEPARDRAARDVKSVVHTMAHEGQEPQNANQLIEDGYSGGWIAIEPDELHPWSQVSDGNTPIRPEEAERLIPRISTTGELNEYEALNILQAREWAFDARTNAHFTPLPKLLTAK
jgi:predicted DNA-binding mobile mystery protein A